MNEMTTITDPNTEILEAMKENKIFWEFLEFGSRDSLMRYFDTLFFRKVFSLINPLLLNNIDSILLNDLFLLNNYLKMW